MIPRGCGSAFDSGQAWHQSCRDVDDMEPGDIHFYVGKHRLLKKSNKSYCFLYKYEERHRNENLTEYIYNLRCNYYTFIITCKLKTR